MKLVRGRIGLILLITVLLLAAVFVLRALVSPAILHTHTMFCFSQLDQAYRDSVASGQQRSTSSQQFLERIPQWAIDWNSCHFRDHAIYDSWGTPADIRVDTSQIILRSAGADRSFDTPDDISHQIPN